MHSAAVQILQFSEYLTVSLTISVWCALLGCLLDLYMAIVLTVILQNDMIQQLA